MAPPRKRVAEPKEQPGDDTPQGSFYNHKAEAPKPPFQPPPVRSVIDDPEYLRMRRGLLFEEMRLGEELMQHPVLLQNVLERCTDAIAFRDGKKQELDVAKSAVASRLRNDMILDAKGNPKQRAETQIESELGSDDAVILALFEYNEARTVAAYWETLAEGYRVKGHTIKTYAELTMAGFLAPNAAYDRGKAAMAAKRQGG